MRTRCLPFCKLLPTSLFHTIILPMGSHLTVLRHPTSFADTTRCTGTQGPGYTCRWPRTGIRTRQWSLRARAGLVPGVVLNDTGQDKTHYTTWGYHCDSVWYMYRWWCWQQTTVLRTTDILQTITASSTIAALQTTTAQHVMAVSLTIPV